MILIKVIDAKYIEGYKINFKFNDGKTKTIDFTNQLWGEIFIPLKNINYFKKFKLNPFTIEWENGADFAPEFLYNFEESINDNATVPQVLNSASELEGLTQRRVAGCERRAVSC